MATLRLAVGVAGLLFGVGFVLVEAATHRRSTSTRLSGQHGRPTQPYWRWPTREQWWNEELAVSGWGIPALIFLVFALAEIGRFIVDWHLSDLAAAAALVVVGCVFALVTYRLVVIGSMAPVRRWWRRSSEDTADWK